MVEWKKLGEICKNVFAGGTPSTKHADYYDGDIPWIRSGEIDFNIIASAERNISEEGYKNSSAKKIRPHSVVMAMTGATVAKTAVVDIETTANQSVCALETDETKANYKYVYYTLAKDYFTIKSSAQGALTSLNLAMIKQIQIPIPSLQEQQRIVNILDTFTGSIENLKEQITQRRKQYEFYRDHLLEFTSKEWPVATLKDVAVIKNGKDYKNLSKGIIPVYGSGGIMTYVNEYASEKPSVLLPRKGSVENIFYVEEPFWTVDTIYWTDINTSKVLPKYLYYSLLRHNMKDYAYGGARPSLSQPILYKLEIPLPSLSEQQRIVSILDTFEASIQNLEQQLAQREKQYEYYRNKLLTFK